MDQVYKVPIVDSTVTKQWHMSQIIMNLRCKGNSAKCYTMVLHKGPTQTWEELHPQGMSLPSLPMIHQ